MKQNAFLIYPASNQSIVWKYTSLKINKNSPYSVDQ